MDPQSLSKIQSDPNVAPVLGEILPPIENILTTVVDANYQGERVLQLLRLEKADAFYRGIQNIAPQYDPANGSIAWVTYGQSTNSQPFDYGNRAFDYNPRKTKSYGDKYVAVLGQRPFWNVGAEAGDPTNENDRRGARQVNLLIQMLHSQWNVKVLNLRLFYYLFKTGTTFGQVRSVTDGRKFGYYEVPNYVMTEQQVGVDDYGQPITEQVPVQQGVNRYPKSSVEVDLINGYIITFPFNVVERDKSPWVRLAAQRDKGELMGEYPNARAIVGSSAGSVVSGDQTNATAAIVRAAAQSQTGTVRSDFGNLWSWQQTWLNPNQFELIEDEQKRALAKKAYPEGARITQIEGKVVEIVAADFRTRFSSCMPSMADYLFCDGAGWGMFGMEDYFSNLLAVTSESLETGIPNFIVNQDYVDADALNRNRYSPNRFISALPRAGENLNNAFALLPTSHFPDQIPGMFEVINGIMQDYLGLQPQVFGQMPPNLTLGQARMMLNQGLMQLGTPGELATHWWEETMTNAVNLYIDTVKINPQFKGQAIDLDLIRNSAWNIKGAAGIPSSFAERKETVQDIIQNNPTLADALELMDPVNFETIVDLLDLPELQNTKLDQINSMREIIDQLWGGQPIQSPDGSMQPSIEFDSLVFDPNVAVALAKKSLVEQTGQQRQNTPGYANVRAFLQAAQQAIPPQPAEPMKVNASVNLNELPANQAQAILQAQGVDVPQPMEPPVNTQSKLMENEQQQQFDLEKQAQQAMLRPPPMENPGQGEMIH
jgi:hypothetical protein